ncbi:MAG: Asp-tRNA(Asn)/Glu-tRNA(Gln) amidotransferase subunit GatC [Bdellovibrionota bacterium]
MSVNVEVLASLARIALEEGDHEKIEHKVNQVLEAFNQLNQVKTDGIEPFFYASPEMTLREDVPEAPLPVEALMKNAPDSSDNCFRIPKVVGDIES